MDPDECLEKIRAAGFKLVNADDEWEAADAGVVLANAVEDLDQWLSKGGFPPKAWRGE